MERAIGSRRDTGDVFYAAWCHRVSRLTLGEVTYMMSKPFRVFLVLIASVAVFAVGTARADVSETPVATACPAGYELLSVATLEATGPYVLPRRVDSAGNNNGYVCGLVRPDSVRDAFCKQGGVNACKLAELDLPIYVVKDDDNPASR